MPQSFLSLRKLAEWCAAQHFLNEHPGAWEAARRFAARRWERFRRRAADALLYLEKFDEAAEERFLEFLMG